MADIILNGTCGDNLTWTLDDEGTLTISGTGTMYDWSNSSRAPWYSHRDSITSAIIKPGATSVGKYAFFNCDNLTSVTLSNSITSIAEYAFSDCDNIRRFNCIYTDNEERLHTLSSNRDGLFYLPCSITSIGIGNNKLKPNDYGFPYIVFVSTTGSQYTEYIEEKIIEGINRLQWTIKDNTLTVYTGYNDTSRIPDFIEATNSPNSNDRFPARYAPWIQLKTEGSLKEWGIIPDIKSIHINFVKNDAVIGTNALREASSCTTVQFDGEGGPTAFNNHCFGGCSSLKTMCTSGNVNENSDETVTIPNTVKKIGSHVFENCSSIQIISIPPDIEVIQPYAFNGCEVLEEFTLNSYENMTYEWSKEYYTVENSILYKGVGNNDGNLNIHTLVKYPSLLQGTATTHDCDIFEIPSTVTYVNSRAFEKLKPYIFENKTITRGIKISGSITLGSNVFYESHLHCICFTDENILYTNIDSFGNAQIDNYWDTEGESLLNSIHNDYGTYLYTPESVVIKIVPSSNTSNELHLLRSITNDDESTTVTVTSYASSVFDYGNTTIESIVIDKDVNLLYWNSNTDYYNVFRNFSKLKTFTINDGSDTTLDTDEKTFNVINDILFYDSYLICCPREIKLTEVTALEDNLTEGTQQSCIVSSYTGGIRGDNGIAVKLSGCTVVTDAFYGVSNLEKLSLDNCTVERDYLTTSATMQLNAVDDKTEYLDYVYAGSRSKCIVYHSHNDNNTDCDIESYINSSTQYTYIVDLNRYTTFKYTYYSSDDNDGTITELTCTVKGDYYNYPYDIGCVYAKSNNSEDGEDIVYITKDLSNYLGIGDLMNGWNTSETDSEVICIQDYSEISYEIDYYIGNWYETTRYYWTNKETPLEVLEDTEDSTFVGWSISLGAQTPDYKTGDPFPLEDIIPNGIINLYPVWIEITVSAEGYITKVRGTNVLGFLPAATGGGSETLSYSAKFSIAANPVIVLDKTASNVFALTTIDEANVRNARYRLMYLPE